MYFLNPFASECTGKNSVGHSCADDHLVDNGGHSDACSSDASLDSFPLMGVESLKVVAANYGDSIIFLFPRRIYAWSRY